MATKTAEINIKAITAVIAEKINGLSDKDRDNSLNAGKVPTKVKGLSIIDIPAFTDKNGKEHERAVFVEYKCKNGKVFTIRDEKTLMGFTELFSDPEKQKALVVMGTATLPLNPVSSISEDTDLSDGYI